jgi:Abortive infection C-terminus
MIVEWLRKLRTLFARPPVPRPQVDHAAVPPAPTGSGAFLLQGCRELLRAHPDILPIGSAIAIIERSIPADPGLAFTHCRGLLETVCKTILADRGVATAADANSNQIMSATLKVLRLTPDEFDKDERVEAGVVDLVRGINQMVNGVVALRNSQGLGPHGRDALETVLDAEYAVITAQAIDSTACLLYRMHRKQAERDPLKRLRFGDYPEFDSFLDEEYQNIEIEETPIQASKALCLVEPEVYRQSLTAFLASPRLVIGEEAFMAGEKLAEDANE